MVKFPDWNSLLTRFEKDFAPLDSTPAARATLDQLKLGTRPVTDYITEFEVLVPQTKYERESLIYVFKKGLNTALLDDLLRLDPIPNTLEKWKSQAMERNTAYLKRTREMAARKETSVFAPRTPKAGNSPSQNTNRTRTLAPVSPGTLGKLTDEERNRLR